VETHLVGHPGPVLHEAEHPPYEPGPELSEPDLPEPVPTEEHLAEEHLSEEDLLSPSQRLGPRPQRTTPARARAGSRAASRAATRGKGRRNHSSRSQPRPTRLPPRAPARHAAPEAPYALLTRLWVVGVPVLLVVLGAVLRVRQWVVGRSLWLDEALIGESLVSRDYAQLVTEPLLHNQAAPVLWLWLERFCVDVFGTDERSLRLVPLLAGIAVPVLTWLVARRVLPAVVTPVPVALTALSPSLVYYSNELKQYSTDVVVVLVLVLLATTVRGRPLAALRLSLAGAALLWLSHAAVLCLAGVSLVLVLRPLVVQQWRQAALLTAALLPWLASLGVAYPLVLAELRDNEVLERYWDYTFPSEAGLADWWLGRWQDLVRTPLDLEWSDLALVLLAVGAVRLVWVARSRGLLVLAVVAMATVAAAMSAYPFAGRLSLWLVPVAALALAALLPDRMDLRRAPWLLVSVACLALVAAPGALSSVKDVREPRYVEELRPVLEQVAAERQPGDTVLIHIAARGAYDYYERFIPVRRDGVILFIPAPPTGCDERIALRTGRFATERVWVVFSHELVDVARLGSTADLIARIQTVTSVARLIQASGAQAYLFDPIAGAQAVQPTTPRNPQRCLGVYRSSR
jgi:hypothetical protein